MRYWLARPTASHRYRSVRGVKRRATAPYLVDCKSAKKPDQSFQKALLASNAEREQSKAPRKNDLGETGPSHARFSPDGKFVAYASNRAGNSAIWLKQVGSGEPFTNQSELGTAASPIWSPDGLQIAFLSKREAQSGIWTMAAFGGSPTLLKLLENYTRELVTWSREGKIYFVIRGNLYTLNVTTQAISPVTKLDSSKPQDRDFAMSPNEEQIAYTDNSDGQSDIWVMPTSGGRPVRVTILEIMPKTSTGKISKPRLRRLLA